MMGGWHVDLDESHVKRSASARARGRPIECSKSAARVGEEGGQTHVRRQYRARKPDSICTSGGFPRTSSAPQEFQSRRSKGICHPWKTQGCFVEPDRMKQLTVGGSKGRGLECQEARWELNNRRLKSAGSPQGLKVPNTR